MVVRILVPLDLSRRSESILPAVEEQARALGAEVVLLHVLPAGPLAQLARLRPATRRPDAEHAAALLEAVADQLRMAGIPARPLICSGGVAGTVARVARREEAALIVLARGSGGKRPGTALTSRDLAIVRRAPSAVLLVSRVSPTGPDAPVVRAFAADAERAGPVAPRTRSLRPVPVARIVGSVGRAAELDAHFRLRTRRFADDARYSRVLDLSAGEGEAEPAPVELYQLGHGYYVVDGHRRVAAAKALGHDEIAAVVTEYAPVGQRRAPMRIPVHGAAPLPTGCGC